MTTTKMHKANDGRQRDTCKGRSDSVNTKRNPETPPTVTNKCVRGSVGRRTTGRETVLNETERATAPTNGPIMRGRNRAERPATNARCEHDDQDCEQYFRMAAHRVESGLRNILNEALMGEGVSSRRRPTPLRAS